MASKKKNRQFPQPRPAAAAQDGAVAGPAERALSGTGAFLVIALGLLLIGAGYVLLGKVDPAGRNTYAVLSPALLLAGYLLIPAALYADK